MIYKSAGKFFTKLLFFTTLVVTFVFLVGGGVFNSNLNKFASAASNSIRTTIGADINPVISIYAPPSGQFTDASSGATPIAPTSNGTIATFSEQVEVSTNNYSGYTLSMSMIGSAENNALNHTLDPSKYSIPSITTPSLLDDSFPRNTWGYNVPIRDESTYQALPNPTSQDPAKKEHFLRTTETPVTQEQTTVNFATKVDTEQAAGTYHNAVLYTAVTNPLPSPTAKAILSTEGNLNFVYDAKQYKKGDIYADNLNPRAEVDEVYEVPYSSSYAQQPQWTGTAEHPNTTIKSVNFTHNFYNYPVANTMYWFSYDTTISQVTNIENLNLNEANSISYMFDHMGSDVTVTDINLDFSKWDTHKISDMSRAFQYVGYNATNFYLDLTGWDTSQVSIMSNMFVNAAYKATSFVLKGIENWNVSHVSTFNGMLYGIQANAPQPFAIDLSSWDTSSATNVSEMFRHTNFSSLGDLSHWDTHKVTNMAGLFYGSCGKSPTCFVGDIKKWDTGQVQDMRNMFIQFAYRVTEDFTLDLAGWNTSNVKYMQNMFQSAGYSAPSFKIVGLNTWDTSKVENMSLMFRICGHRGAPLDLSSWNTSHVTNMQGMFSSARYLQTIYVGYGWNTDNVINDVDMFGADDATPFRLLEGEQGTKWMDVRTIDPDHYTGKTYARIDRANEGSPGYFWGKDDPNPPVNPPSRDEEDIGRGSLLSISSSSSDGATTTTGNEESNTTGYSNPQGAFSAKHIAPGISGPNWFLFILLLVLSILTLGVVLYLFLRKNKKQGKETKLN